MLDLKYKGPAINVLNGLDLSDFIFGDFKPGDWRVVPMEQSRIAGGLGCSRRKIPGAVYLVNELASEINDAFHEKLCAWLKNEGPNKNPGKNRKELLEILEKTENKTIYPEQGVFLFRIANREVLENRKSKAQIPECLEGKAHLEGDLVVFNKAHPIFQRFPRASFRGYIRIDGHDLLKQISKGGRTVIPSIPYCSDIKPNKPMTKAQLATYFASKFGLQKTMVDKFFHELSELALKELESHKSITLPGIGTLVLYRRKARTGETMVLQAKNAVKFRPAKKIKDGI